jgi:hypothetical protein
MADATTRCNGCGKAIDDGAPFKRVVNTVQKGGVAKDRKEWGVFHESCFNKSFDHPDAVLEEMKRQSRAGR